MNKKKNLLIIGGLVLVCGLIYIYISSAGWTYSEGSRAGVVVKFSKKGTFFKTWEGNLSMGAVDQGGVRENWAFSVKDDSMVKKIQKAMDDGHRVKLLYRQQFRAQSWNGQTEYFIVGVKRVGE